MTRHRSPRPRGRSRTDFGRYEMRSFAASVAAFIAEEKARGTTVLDLGIGPVHVSQLRPGRTILVHVDTDGDEYKMGFL